MLLCLVVLQRRLVGRLEDEVLQSVGGPFHVLIAADADGDNVRIVTAYRRMPTNGSPI